MTVEQFIKARRYDLCDLNKLADDMKGMAGRIRFAN